MQTPQSSIVNDNNDFQFIIKNGEKTQIQIVGTNFFLEAHTTVPTYTHVQISNDSEVNQQFKPGKGNFNGYRFELQQAAVGGCLTHRHHPKRARLYSPRSVQLPEMIGHLIGKSTEKRSAIHDMSRMAILHISTQLHSNILLT